MQRCIVLLLLLVSCVVGQRIEAQTVPDSNADSGSGKDPSSAGASRPKEDDDSLDWLFPVYKLNRSPPSLIHLGGEFRGRPEGPTGIGFTGTDDSYYLYRLRVNLGIKPRNWLLFFGEVQDSRIFFYQH